MKLSVAERLNRCLAALGPEMAELLTKDWGPAGAPYSLEELPNGRRRVRIWNPVSGDMYVGAGETTAQAIAALEKKVLAPPAEGESAPAVEGDAR